MRMNNIGARKDMGDKNFKNARLNNDSNRKWKKFFTMMAWTSRGGSVKSDTGSKKAIRKQIGADACAANSTRGYTPGLKDPALGDVPGNRVPLLPYWQEYHDALVKQGQAASAALANAVSLNNASSYAIASSHAAVPSYPVPFPNAPGASASSRPSLQEQDHQAQTPIDHVVPRPKRRQRRSGAPSRSATQSVIPIDPALTQDVQPSGSYIPHSRVAQLKGGKTRRPASNGAAAPRMAVSNTPLSPNAASGRLAYEHVHDRVSAEAVSTDYLQTPGMMGDDWFSSSAIMTASNGVRGDTGMKRKRAYVDTRSFDPGFDVSEEYVHLLTSKRPRIEATSQPAYKDVQCDTGNKRKRNCIDDTPFDLAFLDEEFDADRVPSKRQKGKARAADSLSLSDVNGEESSMPQMASQGPPKNPPVFISLPDESPIDVLAPEQPFAPSISDAGRQAKETDVDWGNHTSGPDLHPHDPCPETQPAFVSFLDENTLVPFPCEAPQKAVVDATPFIGIGLGCNTAESDLGHLQHIFLPSPPDSDYDEFRRFAKEIASEIPSTRRASAEKLLHTVAGRSRIQKSSPRSHIYVRGSPSVISRTSRNSSKPVVVWSEWLLMTDEEIAEEQEQEREKDLRKRHKYEQYMAKVDAREAMEGQGSEDDLMRRDAASTQLPGATCRPTEDFGMTPWQYQQAAQMVMDAMAQEMQENLQGPPRQGHGYDMNEEFIAGYHGREDAGPSRRRPALHTITNV